MPTNPHRAREGTGRLTSAFDPAGVTESSRGLSAAIPPDQQHHSISTLKGSKQKDPKKGSKATRQPGNKAGAIATKPQSHEATERSAQPRRHERSDGSITTSPYHHITTSITQLPDDQITKSCGFTLDQLEVTVEEKELVIRGRQQDDKSRQYLHRGIAARQFQRTFVLADGMRVMGADLKNGLLSIDLVRPEPARVVRSVQIKEHE